MKNITLENKRSVVSEFILTDYVYFSLNNHALYHINKFVQVFYFHFKTFLAV